jgi:hypothetical protein
VKGVYKPSRLMQSWVAQIYSGHNTYLIKRAVKVAQILFLIQSFGAEVKIEVGAA